MDPTNTVELDITRLSERVRRKRQARRLARTRLATRATLSYPAICAIESGRTKKPHRSTIKSIERVLGELPSGLATEVKEDRSSEAFELLGPFPIERWEESIRYNGKVSCIYVFYDAVKRPVRIGQTKDLRRRMKQYEDNYWWFRSPTVESFAYVKVNDPGFRRKAEKVMIRLVGEYAIFNAQEKI